MHDAALQEVKFFSCPPAYDHRRALKHRHSRARAQQKESEGGNHEMNRRKGNSENASRQVLGGTC